MFDQVRFGKPLILTLGLLLVIFISPPANAQICGDADCNGGLDIGDLSTVFDYFMIGEMSFLPCYNNCEADGHSNVNISDFLRFLEVSVPCFPEFCPDLSCFPLQPPLDPAPLAGNEVGIEPKKLPPNSPGPFAVNLFLRSTAPFNGFAVPFRLLIGSEEAQVVSGSLQVFPMQSLSAFPIKTYGNFLLFRGADLGNAGAGTYRVLRLSVAGPTPPGPDSVPITLELVPFPGEINPNTGDSANHPLLIGGYAGATGSYVLPTVAADFNCCVGLSGNVDCDPQNGTDISDLSALIDHLYLTFAPLCCKAEANCDGSLDGNVDIADLSALIDYLYISFTPTAVCQ